MNRRLRMGMVGGGRGAFIGGVHRIAAGIDGKIELVCGAFSSTPAKSKASGADLLLPPDRVYGSYKEMFRREKRLPVGDRMDFVAIVTPNNTHFPVAMAALNAGFHVVCDKPMTLSLAQAKQLQQKVKQTGLLFCLTHNYPGNAMVKEARELVRSGQLGRIRRIVSEYPQGWLATRLEASGQKQADWRTDPKRSGLCGCMGDIGSHAENLAEYITGLKIEKLCADLTTFVPGRKLDDDGTVLAKFEKGAHGIIWASQIAIGCENGLNIRVFGEKGSVEWHQQEPNTLIVDWLDKPREIRRPGTPFIGKAAAACGRIPAGHPEGYLEAFATVYKNFASALTAVLAGRRVEETNFDYPTVADGVRGMAFLETLIKSKRSGGKWVAMPKI